MGAFIEQRDGWGWAITDWTADTDENGVYYSPDTKSADDTLIKTIYIDAHTGSPVFISKTFRLYGTNADTCLIDTLGFVNYNFDDGLQTVPAAGYIDFKVEGYAISDVTITLHTADPAIKFYPMYESGY